MRLVTAASTYPCTIAEMRDLLYIMDTTDHDTRLTLARDSAIAQVEADTSRILAATVFSEHIETSDKDKIVKIGADYYRQIYIGVGPITAVASLTVDGVSQSATTWVVNGPLDTCVYAPQDVVGTLRFNFTAGYSSCPADLKRAVMTLAAHLFQNMDNLEAETPKSYRALIANYGRWIA